MSEIGRSSEIQLSVEEALHGLAPSRLKPLVERVVCGAVDRVLQTWAREQQRKQDIATAANEAANPLYVLGLWSNRECEIRAREQALKAILALPESVRFDQMVVVGRAAAQRVVQEHQDQEERERAQRSREKGVDRYLGDFVYPYLEELGKARNHGASTLRVRLSSTL